MLVKLRPKTFVGTEIETRPTSETNILFWAKFEVKSETRPILSSGKANEARPGFRVCLYVTIFQKFALFFLF